MSEPHYLFGCVLVSDEMAELICDDALRIIERATRELDPNTIECMNLLSGTFSA